jgi:lysophospholipase L1-like esterase
MIALVGLVGLSAMGGDAQMRAFPDGARVAFFGDSLTAGGGVVLRIAAHYRTAFPGRDVRFYNCGISGGRLETADMYFDVVLASRRPTHVVFAFGLNDALEAYNRRVDEPAAEERRVVRELAEFRSRYAEAIGRIEALGAKIVLRIPTPYNEFGAGDSPADAGKNEVVRRFGDEVRAFARHRSIDTTLIYAHDLDAHSNRAAAAVEGSIFAAEA